MPRGDGTGPAGTGPMTGRGAGYCAGYNAPGYSYYGRGMGGGRGYRRLSYFRGPLRPFNNSAMQSLKNQEEYLEMQLKEIKDRLKDLEEDR